MACLFGGTKFLARRYAVTLRYVVCVGLGLWGFGVGACGGDSGGADTVAGDTVVNDSTGAETVAGETTAETAPETVAETADDTVAETVNETVAETVNETEVSEPTTTVAVPGERCALAERVGLVELEGYPTGDSKVVRAEVYDLPNPWYGAPALTNTACAYHEFKPGGACDPCQDDELCSIAGTCTKAPLKRTDAHLTLRGAGSDQSFDANGTTGDLYGDLTLAGRAFAAELSFAGHHVTLVETTIPGELAGAAATLAGPYDQPTGLDVTWTPVNDGSQVFTHIPINHHAGGPTFTECTADASAGSFHVDEGMLKPLAVITGLEFQGIEHTRFAAAHTPLGCVELRYTVRLFVGF